MSVKVLPMSMLIVLPMSVLRAVRGEKAKSFEFPRVRFMGRTDLQLSDAHWDLEPFVPKTPPIQDEGRAPGRGLPAVARRRRRGISAFRFPLSAFQSGAHALILRVRPRYLKKWRSRGSNGLSVRNSR